VEQKTNHQFFEEQKGKMFDAELTTVFLELLDKMNL